MNRASPSSRDGDRASTAPPGPWAISHSSGSTRLWSWMRSTESTRRRVSERSRLARGVARALSCLGGEEELSPVLCHPRRDPKFGVAVGGCRVDVVDAELQQHRKDLVGTLLPHSPHPPPAPHHTPAPIPLPPHRPAT